MQQLAQPTTPQLTPIITQPTMAPTAFTQPLSMPTTPMASPLADPTPGALHLPTLQAIHRMQQQASPTPALAPTIIQLPTTQPTATMPRDPMEYTQTNFPALTPRQLAVLAQLEMQDQQALRSSAHNVLQPSLQTMAGRPAQSLGSGHTQPGSTTTRLLEAGQDTQLRPSSEPHAAPRRERQTRRLPSQDRSRSHTTASMLSPIQKPPPGPPVTQPWSTQGPSTPTQNLQVQIPKPSQP